MRGCYRVKRKVLKSRIEGKEGKGEQDKNSMKLGCRKKHCT
jgi:hypothetical protein